MDTSHNNIAQEPQDQEVSEQGQPALPGPPAPSPDSPTSPAQRTPSPGTITYKAKRKKTYLVRETPDGDVYIPLANFTAKILADLIIDDGISEPIRFYEITAQLKARPALAPRIVVPAADFASMRWVAQLGSDASITAGPHMRDHLRAAIQALSTQKTIRQMFAHTGWRKIDGRWLFLHAGGALGAPGVRRAVETRFEGKFGAYRLPTPLQGDQLRDAIRTVLKLLDLAPDHLMIPLLGATFRVVLGEADFSVHISGDTGAHKTGLAALCQAFFGAEWNERNLPETWFSTVNKLEKSTSDAKGWLHT
jgi:hypothetical protein